MVADNCSHYLTRSNRSGDKKDKRERTVVTLGLYLSLNVERFDDNNTENLTNRANGTEKKIILYVSCKYISIIYMQEVFNSSSMSYMQTENQYSHCLRRGIM